MNIRPHAFVMITFLVISWKSGKANGSETTMKTWKEAVSDCYGNNSFLESNITVLQKYMFNHNKVNDSIWVGSFEALLPWIEIRGCYSIPFTCNSLDIDENNAANLQLCQLKCIKRRYFAFNQKNERCVCFDEHDVVKRKTDNASYCQECIHRGDCNTRAIVYKVFDRPIILAGNNHDCMYYQCSSNGAIPIFSTKECYTYSRSYCRDGRRADGPDYQHFFQYNANCEESHFTYPLPFPENPVKLCNVSESLILRIDVWVGVYRQRLFIDVSDNTEADSWHSDLSEGGVLEQLQVRLSYLVIQDFDQIEQYILRCDHLPANDEIVKFENCSGKHHYKCASDTPMESQKKPPNSSTSSHSCRAVDPDTRETGMIVGIVISISVIVLTMSGILACMYRRAYAKENASLNTDCRRDRHTIEIDNYALSSDYQQLDNIQEKPKPYDQLQVRRNHGNVDTELTTEQINTFLSRDEYSNTDISEYEQLDNAAKNTSTQAYDQLNVTRVKTETTDFFSKSTASREQHSKHESTKATTKLSNDTVTSEYELLNNAKKDKSMHVYDQLHVTDMINNEQTNYNSNNTTSRDQQSNDKPTEERTKLKSMKDTSEYEQLDNAKKDKSVNVYDQLDVADVIDNESTHYNPCQ